MAEHGNAEVLDVGNGAQQVEPALANQGERRAEDQAEDDTGRDRDGQRRRQARLARDGLDDLTGRRVGRLEGRQVADAGSAGAADRLDLR
ncbi:MAG: hypothetical protein U0R78_00595 [Nocardioidaceae bacterium]